MMKKIWILFSILALAKAASVVLIRPIYAGEAEKSERGMPISIMRLIATPERFDGKEVLVFGYVIAEFENVGIYFHREDAEHAFMVNALRIDAPVDKLRHVARYFDECPGYAYVRGVFRAPKKNEAPSWSGSLENISELVFYKKKTEPNQALEHNDPSRHASCCAPVAPTGIVAHL